MRTKIFFVLISLCFASVFAQKQEVKVGDKFYKNFAYKKAQEFYEIAIKKGDSSLYTLTRLGDCYYNNSNAEASEEWFGEAIKKYESKIDPEYFYKYSQALRGNGKYEEAITWLERFKDERPGDDRIASGIDYDNIKIYEELASTEETYVKIENLQINSKFADFGAYQKEDKFYFSSARKSKNKIYDWNGEPFLDLYQATIVEKDGSKTYEKVSELNAEKLNTEFHEANIALTNDGKTMYFTRDNLSKNNKLKTDKEGTSHLKIYRATLIDSTWQNIEDLPINDRIFSTGHPALSPDNSTLFFVSDREGGFGETDIYKVAINADGSFGTPENLGGVINTEGREMFPFVAKDSTLYFSSDSNINLGFLDIFKSDILKDSDDTVKNLGAPYNSSADDFSFFIDSDTDAGYFSSNRDGGKGSDDIYGFVGCSEIIKGVIRDSITKLPLASATVKLIDADGKILKTVNADEEGKYNFKAKCNTKYTILAEMPDYKDNHKEVTTGTTNNNETIVDLDLVPLIRDNEIVINPIFFDFDKWDIRADAAYELENIVSVMREHPDMIIKIESHTDSRGSDKYNMILSDNRAKSTRDYLLSRDIAPERIESAIGYGETQLVNGCSNGVKCTKEQHQANRRSKFIILNN